MTRARTLADLGSASLATDAEATAAADAAAAAVPTGGKNLLYNGAMQVAQRGTSFTASGYTLDRWKCTVSGTATFTQDSSDKPSSFMYALKWTTGAASSFGQFKQFLESADVYRLRGQSLTLSWWSKSSAGYSGSQVAQFYYSNTSDASASVTTQVGSNQTITPTTSWVRYTATTTVPSDAVGFAVFIVPSAVQASGVSFSITGVQLEVGDTATDFEHLPYGVELARCQRYYQKIDPLVGEYVILRANGASGDKAYWVSFPSFMRDVPSMTTTVGTVSGGSLVGAFNIERFGFEGQINTTTNTGYVFFAWTADAEL